MSEVSGLGKKIKTKIMSQNKIVANVLYKTPRMGNLSESLNTAIDDYFFEADEVTTDTNTHTNLMLLGIG